MEAKQSVKLKPVCVVWTGVSLIVFQRAKHAFHDVVWIRYKCSRSKAKVTLSDLSDEVIVNISVIRSHTMIYLTNFIQRKMSDDKSDLTEICKCEHWSSDKSSGSQNCWKILLLSIKKWRQLKKRRAAATYNCVLKDKTCSELFLNVQIPLSVIWKIKSDVYNINSHSKIIVVNANICCLLSDIFLWIKFVR